VIGRSWVKVTSEQEQESINMFRFRRSFVSASARHTTFPSPSQPKSQGNISIDTKILLGFATSVIGSIAGGCFYLGQFATRQEDALKAQSALNVVSLKAQSDLNAAALKAQSDSNAATLSLYNVERLASEKYHADLNAAALKAQSDSNAEILKSQSELIKYQTEVNALLLKNFKDEVNVMIIAESGLVLENLSVSDFPFTSSNKNVA